MTDKILIDASQPEETRVVVLRDGRIEEFDFENAHRRPLRGNIYLAKVVRVEPSLQAAFVEYGENRHGFLAFSEIHPDYYQIPTADRRALLEEYVAGAEELSETDSSESSSHEEENEEGLEPRDFEDSVGNDFRTGKIVCEESESLVADTDQCVSPDETSENGESPEILEAEKDIPPTDGEEDSASRRAPYRHYAIQEVIKRRQVLLVQVMKEERGNKGAALTTYLSLAGRYSVLMPNTPKGGGISRKITGTTDRLRLKELLGDLEIPQGMSMILRTAGASRTKAEVHRDVDYLLRLWERVREVTLHSSAPMLVYEDGSLIKRTIRDLYDENIREILVEGESAYREAYDFMHMLLPKNTSAISLYKNPTPLFVRHNVVPQLDSMLEHRVTLPSGGSIVIMQTEALVSIDVNSGRSTREHTIENTAFKTNLEAAEEVARQLRLRDLSGLIVIDFIDMEDRRNIRGVENRLQESLKYDRARIQVGHISNFGLLEMSRQRLRNSVLESSTVPCAHCGGLGFLRSTASVSVHILHALEEALSRDSKRDLIVHTQPERALHLLNHKRSRLHELEERFGVRIIVLSDLPLEVSKSFTVEQGPLATSLDKRGDSRLRGEVTLDTVAPYSVLEEDRDAQSGGESEDCEDDKKGSERRLRRRRPRRRRGGGRGGCSEPQTTDSLVGQEVQNREGESESVDTASLDDPVSSAVHGASKSRSRFRSPGHRRRSRRRQDDSSSEMADNRGKSSLESSGISKSFGIPETSREEGRRRDLVTHDVHVASSEPQVSAAPKRTGWWARARATLTGDMGS